MLGAEDMSQGPGPSSPGTKDWGCRCCPRTSASSRPSTSCPRPCSSPCPSATPYWAK